MIVEVVGICVIVEVEGNEESRTIPFFLRKLHEENDRRRERKREIH